MSAESINKIFFPALIAIRETDPFITMSSCGDIPIMIATLFPLPEIPHLMARDYQLLKPESPLRKLRDESSHFQPPKPIPRCGGHCLEGLCGLRRIVRVGPALWLPRQSDSWNTADLACFSVESVRTHSVRLKGSPRPLIPCGTPG